jgi:hypothetical protein
MAAGVRRSTQRVLVRDARILGPSATSVPLAASSAEQPARHRVLERLGSPRLRLARAFLPVLVIGIVLLMAGTRPLPPASVRVAADVINPSLERAADGDAIPNCWQRLDRGSTPASYRRVGQAHSGAFAERVDRASERGSSALVVRLGPTWCGPRAIPGHSYDLTAWARGTGTARIIAFYRSSSGAWHHWATDSANTLGSAWRQLRFVAPTLRDTAVEISFGVALTSTGSLFTDDYAAAARGSVLPPPTLLPSPPGYFTMVVPPGDSSSLPSDAICAARLQRSPWEPRPSNTSANHHLVNPDAFRESLASRPRASQYHYTAQWDNWLLPRVDGQFRGTTDEILQWAACKWGLPDNFLRAVADLESTWYQKALYGAGQCVPLYGCGDFFTTEPYPARKTYCNELFRVGGYNYEADYGDGYCPKTFSVVGVMTWWNPSWGPHWADNQNGTFPFVRDSTAAAVDYIASQIRGCYEGWELQLARNYTKGDLLGCAGAWNSGVWYSARARVYIQRLKQEMRTRPWRGSKFLQWHPPCSADYGCPVG